MSLTEDERALLTRYLQQGVGSSTERLAAMSQTEWGVNFSGTQEMSAVRVLAWFSQNRQEHICVKFSSTSDVPLEFMIFFSDTSASAIVDAVTAPHKEQLKEVADLLFSTIGEVSNILAQNVLACLSDAYDTTIILTVPEVSRGAKAALLGESLELYDGRKDALFLANVQLHSEKIAAETSMVIIVNETSLRNLFKSKS
ncbi:MAG: hypothetical protein COB53_05190 [Elusimicrobia bacterium]|nr:MAG: hypothetical protein COB53_05190 [Elusimicrobiota bacterium]